ncbi:MAG: hypothetical protein KGL39_27435 [Patescibacteria group bacterium]|nr:hypothetical protein [Patescibacteria group bacterium]
MSDTALELQPPAALAAFTEQSASMMQQHATAQIQSRYAIAVRFPRNIDQVRQDMLKECKRPSFCMPDESKNGSSVAIYRVPRGKTNIEGVSIRFAEMALRAYKNLGIDVTVLGEDKEQKLYQVTCTDYESNNVTSEIVSVPKTIERSYTKDTDVVISQRLNSYNKPVYTIIGTDDDIAMKRNALISKARRNLIMQNIPGWLVEECVNQVRETARAKDAADPDAAKRKLFDAFAQIGVTAEQLTEYIGHSNALSPEQLDVLRGYYAGIREGVTTWKDIVAAKSDEDGSGEETAKQIEELFSKLGYVAGQIRNIRAKYVGHNDKLLTWLKEQVAKKADDGGKQQADTREREVNSLGAHQLKDPIKTNFPEPGIPTPATQAAMDAAEHERKQAPPKRTPPAAKATPKPAPTSGW